MEAEWCTRTVRQLVADGVLERPFDGNHGELHPKARDFSASGIPFIMASDLKDGRVDMDGCSFISEELARGLRKGFAKEGDVLLSHKATMGRTAIVGPLRGPFLMLTPQVTCYRVRDPGRLNARFLKFYFDGPEFQGLLNRWANKGSTRSYLGITAQLDLPISLPPIDVQSAIAETLGGLDDKIDLNRKMSQTLEEMARALFKSWFVNFDPVHAKAAGKKPYGMDEATAALFPDSFEDSELGRIPTGWRAATLGDVAAQVRDTVNPGELPKDTPYIGLEHMPQRSIALGSWARASEVQSQKTRFCQGQVLFGKLRPYFHKVGLALIDGVCSTDIVVLEPRSEEYGAFCLAVASSDPFVAHTTAGSDGTRMPRTSWQQMAAYAVAVPPSELAARFQLTFQSLLGRIRAAVFESLSLGEIRGLLLPRLLSGELRVGGDLEKEVGAVA